MVEKRLDNTRHRNHSSHNRTEGGIELEETHAILPFCHTDGGELIFEENAGSNAREVGGCVEELRVFCNTVLIRRSNRSQERDGFHGNEF